MNYFNKNRAITLIALVITIVVLVILGGTIFALALGENGLIAKAQNSTSNYAKAKMKEETEVLLAEYLAERESTGISLKDYLNQKNIEYSIDGDGNIILEKDGFFAVINSDSLEIDGPQSISQIVKIGAEPKVVEPGNKVKVTVEVGENIDIEKCKYAFLKKTDEEITEDKITEDLVKKVASTNIGELNLKTTTIESAANEKQKIEIELETEDKIGEYRFYLLVAYKNSDKKMIRKTNVTIGIPATSLKLNKSETTLNKGQTETLIPIVGPSDATLKTVSWSSSDPNVATVDSTGKIIANGVGETIIIATADGGSNVKAECKITVEQGKIETGLQVYLDSKIVSSKQIDKWLDQSGHGNNATISGATWTENDGLYFDGTNDYAKLGFKDYPNITIELVFSSKKTTETSLIGNHESEGYAITLRNNKISGFSYVNGSWNEITNDFNSATNEIMKITYTSNGREMKLYKNGEQVATSSVTNGKVEMPYWNTIMMIGANPRKNGPVNEYFNGNMYLVRIYDRVLAANEIKDNYIYDNKVYNIGENISSGSYVDPIYTIGNIDELKEFRDKVDAGNTFAGKYVELTADIDLSTISNWNPIGSNSVQFQGIFNGNGHKISGLNVNNSTSYQGLFAILGVNGVIENLTIESGTIKGTERVGAIVGESYGVITNCINKATVNTTGPYAGGITGVNGNGNGTVQRCTNSGVITSSANCIGGIAGWSDGIIKFCSNTNSVTGTINVGGMTGWTNKKISSCSNSGAIKATSGGSKTQFFTYPGGIAGSINGGVIEYCKNSGTVDAASGNGASGITFPWDGGNINYCYNTGTVVARKANTTSNCCYSGGISGQNYGNISYCYNAGSVSCTVGTRYAGGISGGMFNSSYKILNCYTLSTKVSSIYGTKTAGAVTNCSKKTDAEMKADALISLLGGTGYWQKVSGGYPKLYWE